MHPLIPFIPLILPWITSITKHCCLCCRVFCSNLDAMQVAFFDDLQYFKWPNKDRLPSGAPPRGRKKGAARISLKDKRSTSFCPIPWLYSWWHVPNDPLVLVCAFGISVSIADLARWCIICNLPISKWWNRLDAPRFRPTGMLGFNPMNVLKRRDWWTDPETRETNDFSAFFKKGADATFSTFNFLCDHYLAVAAWKRRFAR